MVEIVGGVASHADLFHHAPGPQVCRHREGHQVFESQKFEGMADNSLSSFRREAAAPVIGGQPPADFDTRSEMRFESGYRQSDESNELPVFPQFGGIQAEAVLAKMIFDVVGQEVAFSAREAAGHELHDPRIGVQTREWFAVAPIPWS